MNGNTLVLELRPRVANHLLEAESKLIHKYICSDLPYTSLLKTTIETKSSCYDNIELTSVLDSFCMELGTERKVLLVNMLTGVLEDNTVLLPCEVKHHQSGTTIQICIVCTAL